MGSVPGTARGDVFNAETAFCADKQRIAGGNSEDGFDLLFDKFGLRGGQVDFVDDRENGEVVAGGEESVRDGLRFNTLAGVDDEQCAFASGEGAGNFVRKIDVTGRIDQVEAVGVSIFGFIVQANALGFDGDAALALQVHGIEDLLVHFTGAERASHFQQAVGKRGFAVVDVRNNAKIAYELWIHLGL